MLRANVARYKPNPLAELTKAEPQRPSERLRITQLAAQHRLPAIYPLSSHVTEADGLMAYHFDEPAVHKNASSYVDKILKGARPSDLPVQQPSKFRLIINMKTAKSLGLVVPAAILARADEVIE